MSKTCIKKNNYYFPLHLTTFLFLSAPVLAKKLNEEAPLFHVMHHRFWRAAPVLIIFLPLYINWVLVPLEETSEIGFKREKEKGNYMRPAFPWWHKSAKKATRVRRRVFYSKRIKRATKRNIINFPSRLMNNITRQSVLHRGGGCNLILQQLFYIFHTCASLGVCGATRMPNHPARTQRLLKFDTRRSNNFLKAC